ncbi:MAG: multifunctional CCA addition/repair protein [Thermomonas sp.]|uniref:multifunctional CCA addition/repair protein n=1 Tax=Thermomonas sp. TaxID=1971895 RepID=UPI002622D669|nr:multifunctional CCA addition/repair protein [Thermomonas sp.]MCC7097125.1 multifunctional CCA addition/repair protein [Thermomonas sp.]
MAGLPGHARIYLVGGAVRDALLGQPPGDRDFVVVGATAEQMLGAGYTQVGRDFPVFLHPQTGEEYALARTERKSGRGYTGFAVHADPSVTLEEDLRRRDFTINAIAQADDGSLVDPFGGAEDIRNRVLRHVSEAFVEDPLRVLRAARFMARFAPLGLTMAPETLALMRTIADSGELATLAPERVWQELAKALRSAAPSAFLRTLRDAHALPAVLPEVDALYGVPQRADYHPEIDTGTHVEMVCDMAARLAPGDELIGYGALCHDLGKALTPAAELPRHVMHEQRGVAVANAMSERLKAPSEHRELAALCSREHLLVHRIAELKPATIHDLIARCDGFRKPVRIDQLATVCEADARGRQGHRDTPFPQATMLRHLFAAAQSVRGDAITASGLKGPDFGAALRKARIAAIAQARSQPAIEP